MPSHDTESPTPVHSPDRRLGSIVVQERDIDGRVLELAVSVEGLAGWHVGLPATADRRNDLITLLRRLADNLEAA